MTSLFVFSTRALRLVGIIPMTFWSNLVGVLLAAAVLPFLGSYTLPTSQVGWTGTLGASACYMLAVLCVFSAIHWARPVRAALYFNLEPIVTMASAAQLLGESLLPPQYVGTLLVVAALALAAQAAWARPLSRHGEHGP
ncbi:MAG: EamA family transporter [Rhodospirillales bacterium]|nr:EamA family transporter [Rhodospirillales bacterium]HJO72585.1 EamA family transporter [Rhodospirillales bacterium]